MSEPIPDPLVDGYGGCTGDMYSALLAQFSANQTTTLCDAMGSATADFLTASSDPIVGLNEGLNCLYLVLCAALVFVMHAGFAMVRRLCLPRLEGSFRVNGHHFITPDRFDPRSCAPAQSAPRTL